MHVVIVGTRTVGHVELKRSAAAGGPTAGFAVNARRRAIRCHVDRDCIAGVDANVSRRNVLAVVVDVYSLRVLTRWHRATWRCAISLRGGDLGCTVKRQHEDRYCQHYFLLHSLILLDVVIIFREPDEDTLRMYVSLADIVDNDGMKALVTPDIAQVRFRHQQSCRIPPLQRS